MDAVLFVMLISIIVPVYNVADFLPRFLGSVEAQLKDNADVELILVNDGSTDSSPKLIDEFACRNQRIIVIHQNNAGVSAARNAGLEKATGKYVAFSDSDDWLDDDYVDIIRTEIERTSADIITFATRRHTGQSSEFIENVPVFKGTLCSSRYVLERIRMGRGLQRSPWDKLYCRKLLTDECISFSTGLELGEDIVFNLNAFIAANSVASSAKVIYHYNKLNAASVTSQSTQDYARTCYRRIALSVAIRHFLINRRISKDLFKEIIKFSLGQLLRTLKIVKKIQSHHQKSDVVHRILAELRQYTCVQIVFGIKLSESKWLLILLIELYRSNKSN